MGSGIRLRVLAGQGTWWASLLFNYFGCYGALVWGPLDSPSYEIHCCVSHASAMCWKPGGSGPPFHPGHQPGTGLPHQPHGLVLLATKATSSGFLWTLNDVFGGCCPVSTGIHGPVTWIVGAMWVEEGVCVSDGGQQWPQQLGPEAPVFSPSTLVEGEGQEP